VEAATRPDAATILRGSGAMVAEGGVSGVLLYEEEKGEVRGIEEWRENIRGAVLTGEEEAVAESAVRWCSGSQDNDSRREQATG
jgi:hypothetical protein